MNNLSYHQPLLIQIEKQKDRVLTHIKKHHKRYIIGFSVAGGFFIIKIISIVIFSFRAGYVTKNSSANYEPINNMFQGMMNKSQKAVINETGSILSGKTTLYRILKREILNEYKQKDKKIDTLFINE